MYIYIYIYIHIYIYNFHFFLIETVYANTSYLSIYLSIHLYIYIYIYIQTSSERRQPGARNTFLLPSTNNQTHNYDIKINIYEIYI